MIFIPRWLTNIFFLLTFYLSIYQHVRMREMKPTLNFQFFMAVFALLMVLVVTFESVKNAWLSLGFLVLALACLGTMYRQMRYLPPRRRYD